MSSPLDEMILVNAVKVRFFPDCNATNLLQAAISFDDEEIAWSQNCLPVLGFGDANRGYIIKINSVAIDVCNSEI